ncbi:MAG: HD-GYP domain-containing protein [Bacteriovoracaceae bacterium]
MKHDKERFISLQLNQLAPEVPLPADLYLFLNGHFIKYKLVGDIIPAAKYNEFFSKKVDFVFCLMDEIKLYDAWASKFIAMAKEEMVKNVGSQNAELVERRAAVSVELFKIFSGDVSDERSQKLQETTRLFIESINSKKSSQACLNKLMNYSPSIAEHSVNVATLSIYLCMHLGYAQQIILENVYMGSLLHDIGKTRINSDQFEKSDDIEKAQIMKTHVELGRIALSKANNLSSEVLKIVAEHHEHQDGTGYPKRLRGQRIYELTKIVSIANVFDNYASSLKGTLKERQKYALEQLAVDHNERFDPKKLHKCLEVLRHGL